MPLAPGTWGSLVGLLLGVVAARTMSWLIEVSVLAVLFPICALVCGQAERRLGQHDPSSVILDEVWGMAAVIVAVPSIAASWPLLAVAFLLFRTFDIAKPPPLTQFANLPAGWGIMADDFGAAAYTICVLWVARTCFRF